MCFSYIMSVLGESSCGVENKLQEMEKGMTTI